MGGHIVGTLTRGGCDRQRVIWVEFESQTQVCPEMSLFFYRNDWLASGWPRLLPAFGVSKTAEGNFCPAPTPPPVAGSSAGLLSSGSTAEPSFCQQRQLRAPSPPGRLSGPLSWRGKGRAASSGRPEPGRKPRELSLAQVNAARPPPAHPRPDSHGQPSHH